jgi:glycosyltransferase involved in cell wall biosynthesis
MNSSAPVVHLSYAPKGGAGNIAKLLVNSQQELGVDSRLVTASDKSISEAPQKDPLIAVAALVDQFLLAKKDAELMTILRARVSRIARDVSVEGSVLHLHWMPGALSDLLISEMAVHAVKTVWTLHDYRPFTGGCHYPSGCMGYESGCAMCPQVRAWGESKVRLGLSKKTIAFSSSKLNLVAPSHGLLEAAGASKFAVGHSVSYIPNPVDSSFFLGTPESQSQARAGNYLFVAANVEERRKGLWEVLSWWKKNRKSGEALRIIGAGSEKFGDPESAIIGLGSKLPEELQKYYSESSALLFASTEDNAPGVIAEAALARLPIVCLNEAMIGWLVKDGLTCLSIDEVRSLQQSDHSDLSSTYRSFLAEREPIKVAQKYLDLYYS